MISVSGLAMKCLLLFIGRRVFNLSFLHVPINPIPNGEVKTIIIPAMLMMEGMMYRVAMYLIQDFFATLCCRKLIPRMAALIKVLVVISKAINS
jgi:hypothetical protein